MKTSNEKFKKLCESLIVTYSGVIRSFWGSRHTKYGKELIRKMIADIKVQRNYICLINRNKLSAE